MNLAEQQGKEGSITEAYRNYVQELNSKDVVCAFVLFRFSFFSRLINVHRYHEYDFHTETKGMKFVLFVQFQCPRVLIATSQIRKHLQVD